ncbi:MAG: hypothetical protein R3E13_11230 [Alphaproteobacteria bacterium]
MDRNINEAQAWILLPPGDLAICRYPVEKVPEYAHCASARDLNTANLARPFPWGYSNTPERAGPLWHKHRIGIGGLYHDKWFVTPQGRFGGAADGGHIIVGPLDEAQNKAYVGFVGRCQTCPNPELISFRQLQKAVPDYEFELFDEWKNWSLIVKPEERGRVIAV